MKERILAIVYSTNALLDVNYTDILISEVNYDQSGHCYARTMSENQNCTRQTGTCEQPVFDIYSFFELLENGLGERGLKIENRKSTSGYRGKNSKMNS